MTSGEVFKNELLYPVLNMLRAKDILCDTTIRAEGQDFAAHKHVLSAASEYFRAMFASQMKETESNVVELQGTKSTTVSNVIQFIYTGKANIDSTNAQDLVIIADYLIIPSLKTEASLFLQGSIDASNCLALEYFASQYNCETLEQAVGTYKLKNFVVFSKTEDFRGLGLVKIKELICKDDLNVSREEEVYEAVIAWVEHDLPSRECLLPELLKCVRLFSMSKYNLREILNEELISKNPACMIEVINALDFFLFPDRFHDMTLKPRLSLDKYEHVVMLTGGVNSTGFKLDTQCFVPSTMTWGSLPKMPRGGSGGGAAAAAVCGGLLYILGVDNELDQPSMFIFNTEQNKWMSQRVTFDVRDCSVTCFNEELYLIGGDVINEFDSKLSSDVQIYNPVLDEWRKAAPMKTCRASHSAVLLQDHIYVIAGHNNEVCLNSVECYNPLTDQWDKVSNISKARMQAACARAAGKIVVVGGFRDTDESCNEGTWVCRNVEPSCEIYEPITNQWSLVSSPGFPRAACSAASIGDMVYLFGGLSEFGLVDTVECLDVRSGCYKWNLISTALPYDFCCAYLQATVLKIPKKNIVKYSSLEYC